MRDVLNSEEFAEETETHRVINTLRPAQRQSVILLTQFNTCLNTGSGILMAWPVAD